MLLESPGSLVFKKKLRFVNSSFLKEVMVDLVTEGQSWKSQLWPWPRFLHNYLRSNLGSGTHQKNSMVRTAGDLQSGPGSSVTYFWWISTPTLARFIPKLPILTLKDQDRFGKLPKLKLGVNHQKRRSKLGKDYHSLYKSSFYLVCLLHHSKLGIY